MNISNIVKTFTKPPETKEGKRGAVIGAIGAIGSGICQLDKDFFDKSLYGKSVPKKEKAFLLAVMGVTVACEALFSAAIGKIVGEHIALANKENSSDETKNSSLC